MSKFQNECIDCNYKGREGLWKVEGYKGLAHIKEYYKVEPEFGPNPEHFDLDVIDAQKLMKKYNISAEDAEDLILSGEPCCPECKSENFFSI